MNLLDFLRTRYAVEHALTLQPQSLEQLRYAVESFGKHLGRPPEFSDLARPVVIEWLAARKNAGLAPATINKDRRSLLCIWRHAADLELVMPPPRVPKCRVPVKLLHTFVPDELSRLIKAGRRMSRPRRARYDVALFWESLIVFLYDSGARIAAALRVKTADVDLDLRVVTLRGENAKTGATQIVSISDDCVTLLRKMINGREGNDHLWPWPCNPRRIFVAFRKLTKLAGVTMPKGRAFHSFRRTHATLVAEIFGIEVASRQLGHSSTQVTRMYVKPPGPERIADRLPRIE